MTVSSKGQNLIKLRKIQKIYIPIKIRARTKLIKISFLKSFREISIKETATEAFQL